MLDVPKIKMKYNLECTHNYYLEKYHNNAVKCWRVRVMVINATFNNISVIS